jgi:surfeit locus 1 family protein
MRRLPLLPTLIVALAVAAMIALGLWQMRRAEWKDRLLADYARAETLPALDLDPLLDGHGPVPPLSFRKVLVTCNAENAVPELRGGRSLGDAGGYTYRVPCRPGADGLAGRLVVNAGWTPLPDDERRVTLAGIVAGRLGAVGEDGPILVTAATATAPLQPARPPGIEDIPNNHRGYVVTWFGLAIAALVIYLIALRRRRRELPPEP